MEDISMLFHAFYMLVLCIFISIIVTAVYSFIIYRGFENEEDAMNAYRASCTHALSHKIMRYMILICAVIFAAWTVYNRHILTDKHRLWVIYSAVLFFVASVDLFVFPHARDAMARTRIFYHLRLKYNISDGTVTDWFIDLDEDDYPEELEIDISESGKERCFIIDLEHKLIREEKTRF